MSTINNALLPMRSLRAQPHAVLVASVADGADAIARLKEALNHALGALREEKRFGTVGIIQASLINNGINLAADDFERALGATK